MEELPIFLAGVIVTTLVVVGMLLIARSQAQAFDEGSDHRVRGDVRPNDPRLDGGRDAVARAAATSRSRRRATRG